MDDNNSESSEPHSLAKKAKSETKKWYDQLFNDAVLKGSELADWISKDPGNNFNVRCKVCEMTFKGANKSALMKHNARKKHVDAFKAKQNTLQVSTFFQKQAGPDIDESTAKAEVLLSGFLPEHRTPFLQADHLSELMKKVFPDSKIAQKIRLQKTKASYVLQEGISREEVESLSAICQKNKFSLIIYESTDISVSQILAIVVRFYYQRNVSDALLTALEVDDGTAEGLYAAVKNFFEERAIPLSNIIGFASDNCSTMMGGNAGFQALLKTDVPGVLVLGCICHSFALCAHHASNCLPSWLEAFVKDVCCYFVRSSKRQHQFRLIQHLIEAPRHKVLKLSQTRWLSRGQVVARILEQWDALKLFFQSESRCDRVDGVAKIYQTMTTIGTKHILAFLNYILSKVDRLNVECQAQDFKLHTLYSSVSDEYRSILAMFIQYEVVRQTPLDEIDPCNVELYKPLKDVHLGGRCIGMCTKQSLGNQEERVRADCRNFLVELCNQIKKRFCFKSDGVLALLSAVNPSEALSSKGSLTSSAILAQHFPSLVSEHQLDELDDQRRQLLYAKDTLKGMSDSPTKFWDEIRAAKDGNGVRKFELLGNFMCNLLVLPHSSACIERIFSQVNMIKTPQTNRLHCSTLCTRLIAMQAFARQSAQCHTWEPSKKLVQDVQFRHCRRRYFEKYGEHQEQLQEEEFGVYDVISEETVEIGSGQHITS